MSDFEKDFLSELGFDASDPCVQASIEDAEAHARLIETLVKIRNSRHLPQTVVAERMGTTQSRVSSFERIGGDPRLSTLLRYARAVDTKLRIGVSAAPRGWEPAARLDGSTVAARHFDHYEWTRPQEVS